MGIKKWRYVTMISHDVQRVRKIDEDALLKIILYRGFGFNKKKISEKFNVTQEAIAYHLNKLKAEVEKDPERIYDVFTEIVMKSKTGTQNLVGGIIRKLIGAYEAQLKRQKLRR